MGQTLRERISAFADRWRIRWRSRRWPHLYVVSGLPRSGTSLMMRILHRAGIPVVTDSVRTPDPSNPEGYYEHERVKRLSRGDSEWLSDYEGHAVKVVAPLLEFLPTDLYAIVIFMNRDLDEIIQSQEKMIRRLGTDGGEESVSGRQLRIRYEGLLCEVRTFLDRRERTDMIEADFNRLVTSPESELGRVKVRLNLEASVAELASVVDPTLYRSRSERFRESEPGGGGGARVPDAGR